MFKLYSLPSARLWSAFLLFFCYTVTVAQSVTPLTGPTPGGRNPSEFAVYNGRLYFSGIGENNTNKLWSTDGASEGTRLVETREGNYASEPKGLTVFRGRLYFSAQTFVGSNTFQVSRGRELWVSDGTPYGTHLLKDIAPLNESSDPQHLTVTQDKLFFTVATASGRELWVSDGTPDGSRRLADVVGVSVGANDPTGLTAVGNKLFYTATVVVNGDRSPGLWVTDGTSGGTRLVKGGRESIGQMDPFWRTNPRSLTDFNGKVVFVASGRNNANQVTDDELWVSDGTPEGTDGFDLHAFSGVFVGVSAPNFTVLNNLVYFRPNDGKLWVSDGTFAGTKALKSVVGFESARAFGGKLFFSAGNELWESDGSEAGTRAVSGAAGGARNLTVANGRLYYTSTTGSPGGALWSTDGTATGAYRVAEGSGILENRVKSLLVFNDQLYLTAFPFSSASIAELYRLNANRPPIAPAIANATGTVGTWFNQVIPAFTDPDGGPLSYNVVGLPAGLSFSGGSGGIVGGNPTMAGVYTVTVTATDRGGLSASATYTLTINASGSGNLAPIPALIPDQTIGVNQPFSFDIPAFTDPEGRSLAYLVTGLPAGFSHFWSAVNGGRISGQTPVAGRYTITVKATDPQGAFAIATFQLTVGTSSSTLQLLTPSYECWNGFIRFNTSGGDGSPITYVTPGITRVSATANTGIVEADLRRDPKPIVIQAIQNGVSVSYTFDLPNACRGGVSQALQLLAPTYDCSTGAIRFNTNGGNGMPITYVAPGISRGALTDNFGIVEADLRRDPKPIRLQAIQNAYTVSYTFDLPNACGRARVAVAEELTTDLSVKVLGNPVIGETVDIEIRGAEGKPLVLNGSDMKGNSFVNQRIEHATAVERHTIRLGQTPGVYLLRVATPTKNQAIKLIKAQ
ncbi:hypothetical protein GCM10028807_41940 [Spirosoma daeguense]